MTRITPLARGAWLTGVAMAGMAMSLPAQLPTAQVDSAVIAGLRWRNIGPANMSGRIVDVEGIPSPSRTFYVATAAGGIWKTTNAGTTFQLVFGDNQPVISMGDIAIAPSDTNVIYAGSGEPNSRNSISPGGGIFKSTDGGRTWKLTGLEKTQAIGRVVVHPTNPNVVWVAALGAPWNSNPERGLYKTTDGGATWTMSKFISDKAGFVDIDMHPTNPDILFATSWERVRGPYFLYSGGPGSAMWKTTDGGTTWTEIKGGGLPETNKGRMEFAIARSNPQIMYAMIEADTTPNPRPTAGARQQTRPSGLWRSNDGGVTWARVAPQNVRPFYYSQVRVDTKDPERVYFTSTPHLFSPDGGKTVRSFSQGLHVDTHAHWIDPNDPNYQVVGNDGGIGVTFDRGGNWIFPNSFPIGQFYNISYDMGIPYRACGGLQDNGSWCGPSRRRGGPITNAHWYNVGGGDGFGTQQDQTNPAIVYATSQGGNIQRRNILTGEGGGLAKPQWRTQWLKWQDSIIVVRGDTTVPETREQRARIAAFRANATRDSLDLQLRWNWNTPYFLSPHNQSVFYAGANRVMKSVKRGDEMYPISPDLSTMDTMKIRISTRATGGITPDITQAETYGTIVALNESPIRPGLLVAGTDDGNVWITRNDGGNWENLTGRFPGVPKLSYVSRIEPSYADEATFYVTFDNHRTGDYAPYVYVTNDFGKSFRSISNNLPKGGVNYVHVIREDPTNPNLLFVGTDVGAYFSTDKGASWRPFMSGLPTVPVNDLKIHPRDRELIAGTHGRSIWVADIAPLQQATAQAMTAPVYFFQPATAWQYPQPPADGLSGGGTGHLRFVSNPPPYGAEIVYRVAQGAGGGRPARISIVDASGDTIRTITGSSGAGLHRVVWPFNGRPPARAALSPAQKRDSARMIARIDRAVDSLAAAGGSRPGLDSAKTQLMAVVSGGGGGGGFGGGGGGGGGAPGLAPFQARPGEGGVVGQGGGGGGGGGGLGGNPLVQALGGFQAIQALVGGGGGGGGGFGGGGAPTVDPGDYLVVVEVGGQKLTRKLRVEKTTTIW